MQLAMQFDGSVLLVAILVWALAALLAAVPLEQIISAHRGTATGSEPAFAAVAAAV